jgi:hypothetical protein
MSLAVETPRLWTPRRRTDKRICAPPVQTSVTGLAGFQRPDPFPLWPMYYPNLWQWCYGAAGIVSSGGIASRWEDQSAIQNTTIGNNSYTQTTAGLTVTTASGFPALGSAGGTKWLQTANSTSPTYSTFKNHSLFVVVQPTAGTQTAFGRILEQNFNNSFYLGLDTTHTKYQYIVADASLGTCTGGTVVVGTPVILTAIYSSTTTTGTLQINGTTVNSNTFSAPSLTSTDNVNLLTNASSGGTNGLLGDVLEVMIYTDAKAGAALTQLNRYLGKKYNITVP